MALEIKKSPNVCRDPFSKMNAAAVPPTSPPSINAYLWCSGLRTRLIAQTKVLKIIKKPKIKKPNLIESLPPNIYIISLGFFNIFLREKTIVTADLIK